MTASTRQSRDNMVNNQIRGWEVVDVRVLDTLSAIRREDFVPEGWRNMAFADMTLPLGHGEVMMKPVVEGRMLQALQVMPGERVLEIGTGSGFMTACLATLASHVTSIDLRKTFTDTAGRTLASHGIDNVALVTADAVLDFSPDAHFDVIVATGAVAEVPQRWLDWMTPEGRLFAIHGREPIMCASLLHNNATGQPYHQGLFDTCLPYLEHAAPPPDYSL